MEEVVPQLFHSTAFLYALHFFRFPPDSFPFIIHPFPAKTIVETGGGAYVRKRMRLMTNGGRSYRT
jgi:hypothetical protein